MAKITAPFLALGASGTIAKTLTASKWRGRPYLRQRVVPSNPRTAAQTLTRDTFAWANAVWKRAPTLMIAPWDRFADGQVLTGRNAFQGNVVRTLRGDADLTDFDWVIGAKGGIPPLSAPLTPSAGAIVVDPTAPALPTGWLIQAIVAAAIKDQDPASGVLYEITAGEDLTSPYQIILGSLSASVLYSVGTWIRWLKPDLTIAYSAALVGTATPTA